MKNKIQIAATVLAIGFLGVLTPVASDSTSALKPFRACDDAAGSSSVCRGKKDNLLSILEQVINTLLLLVGVIAVISIIVSGIRFITSDGDSNKVASARNGVIYSVVGLTVAIMAFAIVRFVVGRIG